MESLVGYICLEHNWTHCPEFAVALVLRVVVVVQDKLKTHSVLLVVVARLTKEVTDDVHVVA